MTAVCRAQGESQPFADRLRVLSPNRSFTTAYCNVVCSQLGVKAALAVFGITILVWALPTVLLGSRSDFTDDIGAPAAEIVYSRIYTSRMFCHLYSER